MNKEKDPKKRILTTCVKMFIEKGYKETTMMDIIKKVTNNLLKLKKSLQILLINTIFNSHEQSS